MEDILFIVNPLSEKRKGIDIRKLIVRNLDLDRYSYTIEYSKYSGHAHELARENSNRFQKIIAAGGDGTVNQVSKALVHTNNQLGIIPLGSGNGLARSLGIPLKPSKAIRHLNTAGIRQIDTGEINGFHFLNMAGIGFDAEIAHSFGLSGKRGFISYIMDVAKRFRSYVPITFDIAEDGNQSAIAPFLISFANSSQYGNNAHISPNAKPDDGLMDVCILHKFPLYHAPILAARLFLKSIDKSNYITILRKEHFVIEHEGEVYGHVDGEPVLFKNDIAMQVNKKSISIIC